MSIRKLWMPILTCAIVLLGTTPVVQARPANLTTSQPKQIQKKSNKSTKVTTGRLSTFSTRAGGDAKRLKNIQLAVGRIDGTRLAPGQGFSLNRTVGPRTGDRGFRTATVFENRKKVPGVGGGVSQVTGTLFNAAALAGLRIDEAHAHSRPVAYLPPGRDATVEYGTEDLKFTNTTGAPVTIRYTLRGRELRASLFGKKIPGQKIALQTKVKQLAPGKVGAQLYRIISRNGKQVKKEQLYNHIYLWNPKG